MTFEKHLRSVSSAAAQRLGIMIKSWQVFHDRSLILRSFWSFVLPVLECCSAVWCSSAADSHLKLLDRVVRSAVFLAGAVLDCNLAHRRSVAELCMLFKIKNNPMHPLSGALPLPYVPGMFLMVLWLLIGTRSPLLVVGLLSIAESLCPSRCLFGTILVTLCLMVWNWRVSRAEPMLSCWHNLLFIFCLLLFYLLFLPSMGWLCGVGIFWLMVFSLSPGLAQRTLNNNNNNNNNNNRNGFRFSSSKTCCMDFYPSRPHALQPELQMKCKRISAVRTVKFLGLHWDQRLSWIPHISQLKNSCMRALALLRSPSNSEWGADRDILMRTYRWIRRPKLDYGCVIYNSASEQTLRTLNAVLNEAMRICSDAFKTTPVECLHVVTNEPSLCESRKNLTNRYFFQTKSLLQNITYSCVIN